MLLFGGMWILGLWVRKAVECFEWSIMDHTGRNIKDSHAEDDLNYQGLAQEATEKDNFSMLPRDCSCDILVKNLAAFCPCLKSLL